MPDQRACLSLDGVAQRIEPGTAFRRTENHRHQLAVRLEGRKLGVIGEQVDLVDAQQRLSTAALNGDEEAIDQPRSQRRRLDANDMDHQIEIRRDHALTVWVTRIGTGEDRLSRQYGHDAVSVDGDTVADRQIAFPSKHDVDLLAALKNATTRAADGDDNR